MNFTWWKYRSRAFNKHRLLTTFNRVRVTQWTHVMYQRNVRIPSLTEKGRQVFSTMRIRDRYATLHVRFLIGALDSAGKEFTKFISNLSWVFYWKMEYVGKTWLSLNVIICFSLSSIWVKLIRRNSQRNYQF